jgi:hypothetical protein
LEELVCTYLYFQVLHVYQLKIYYLISAQELCHHHDNKLMIDTHVAQDYVEVLVGVFQIGRK